jgi:hypothetical protein
MDQAGNLYVYTPDACPIGNGVLFKLTPSDTGWILTDLHDFGFSTDDGSCPIGSLAVDTNGNIHCATQGGGD